MKDVPLLEDPGERRDQREHGAGDERAGAHERAHVLQRLLLAPRELVHGQRRGQRLQQHKVEHQHEERAHQRPAAHVVRLDRLQRFFFCKSYYSI